MTIGQVLLSNKSTSYFKGESMEGNFETNTLTLHYFNNQNIELKIQHLLLPLSSL